MYGLKVGRIDQKEQSGSGGHGSGCSHVPSDKGQQRSGDCVQREDSDVVGRGVGAVRDIEQPLGQLSDGAAGEMLSVVGKEKGEILVDALVVAEHLGIMNAETQFAHRGKVHACQNSDKDQIGQHEAP